MNIGSLNQIFLDGGLPNNTGYADIPAFIAVNTNPAFATFKDIRASISVASQQNPSDLSASIVISDYKWMTQTLIDAQKATGLRPYFSATIVDDTIEPETILTPPGKPLNGEIVTAPDGSLLAVGDDGTGKLCFWHITNPDDPTQWATPTTVLASSYLNNFNATIACSDYILGSYAIDIYYAVDNSGNINIVNQHSTNGGVSWSSAVAPSVPGIITATTDNFCLSAVQPVLNFDGTVRRMFFYIVNDGDAWYNLYYQAYSGIGSFSAPIPWTSDVNPTDLIIHSIDAFYDRPKDVYHIVLSAYHQFEDNLVNQNYGIYQTELTHMTTGVNDVWKAIQPIFTNTSSSANNLNNFTYPKITYDNEFYRILFKAVIVDSVQNSAVFTTTNVGTVTYYFMTQSKDFENFTYPFPLLFTDGTVFGDDLAYSFNKFGNSNFYVGGNGLLWKYLINNIVADVTDSIVNYEVSESAGVASTLTMTIGNMANQWYGDSPTKPGAAAIARNMKIYLNQGYYNALNVPEIVPRDIFYIDDIQLQVTSNQNQLVLSSRNIYKNLKTFVTKYAYNFKGVRYYSDIFDGSTLSDWNQLGGQWQEVGGEINPVAISSDTAMITHQIEDPNNSEEAMYCLYAAIPAANVSGRELDIYPYYQDSDNYLIISFATTGVFTFMSFQIKQDGVLNPILTNIPLPPALVTGETLPILIHRYDFTKYTIVLGSNLYNTVKSLDPNTGSPATVPFVFQFFGPAEFDILDGVSPWKGRSGVFAVSCVNWLPNISLFKHVEYGNSQSIQDIVQKVGSLSTVYDYNIGYNFNDTEFNLSDYVYTGVPLHEPGFLRLPPSTTLVNKTFSFTNNEIEFRARLKPSAIGTAMNLNFFFRTSANNPSFNAGYIWNIRNNPQPGIFTSSRIMFRDTIAGGDFLFNSSTLQDFSPSNFYHNLNIDLTQWHTYRLVAFDGWMFGFIDDQLVIAWQDNHVSNSDIYAALASGGIGFGTDANTTVDIQYVRSRLLWNQVQNFALSPGDDADSSLKNLLDTVQAWLFSDLMGKVTNKILGSDEPDTYTYDNGIVAHSVDDSDKEYVNQITVYGFNVSAVAQDTASISQTGKVREMTVVDYKITTYQDALARAQNELVTTNRFQNQNTPQYPMNVGAEIFDVVHIINTGDNSSNIDADFRIYNQNLKNPGSNAFYGIELQAGTL